MAKRRMFSLDIVNSDPFLEMPSSAQALYFHLGMRCDDDGFLNNARMVTRMVGASVDDLKLLIAKKFVIAFESDVFVIKHFRLNNYIRKDRYTETRYLDEKKQLYIRDNGVYTLNSEGAIPLISMDAEDGIPVVDQMVDKRLTQSSLVKSSLVKSRLDKSSLGQSITSLLTQDEIDRLDRTFKNLDGLFEVIAKKFDLRENQTKIKKPYAYIIKVAEDMRWPTQPPEYDPNEAEAISKQIQKFINKEN